MIDILNQKPAIGIAGGLTSGILYLLKELFTDDLILKWIAGLGIWMGLIVAALTVWLRVIEIRKTDR
jgi:cyanate permease